MFWIVFQNIITQKSLNEIDRFTINLPDYLNEANYFRWDDLFLYFTLSVTKYK